MEIKTCEEYVLSLLKLEQDTNRELTKELDNEKKTTNKLQNELDIVIEKYSILVNKINRFSNLLHLQKYYNSYDTSNDNEDDATIQLKKLIKNSKYNEERREEYLFVKELFNLDKPSNIND